MTVPDSSVLIAALAGWHQYHAEAQQALSEPITAVGHCVVEAYSVLTRLPEPYRMTHALAADALARLVQEVQVLDARHTRQLPERLAAYGVRGGAVYDGLIATTAAHFDSTLVTLDARAAGTYRACGADFRLIP